MTPYGRLEVVDHGHVRRIVERHGLRRSKPRIAFVTIGQAPRVDVVPDILGMLDGVVDYEEFGALDGLTPAEIASQTESGLERRLYTRLRDGRHVEADPGFVVGRLTALLQRLDGLGFDLIVLLTTGVFQSFSLRTPLVHGQRAVDAWIDALVVGNCRIGVIYPLAKQAEIDGHGTLIQNARAVAATGEAARLADAAAQLTEADLILMHSVGYSEENARSMAAATGKPVVTARRIIVGVMRLHLSELGAAAGAVSTGLPTAPPRAEALIDRLPPPSVPLTPRERQVLACVMDGEPNKVIARRLGISHRTVEIHRGRAMSKLEAGSPAELIRRVLLLGAAGG
jgi:protein AroM